MDSHLLHVLTLLRPPTLHLHMPYYFPAIESEECTPSPASSCTAVSVDCSVPSGLRQRAHSRTFLHALVHLRQIFNPCTPNACVNAASSNPSRHTGLFCSSTVYNSRLGNMKPNYFSPYALRIILRLLQACNRSRNSLAQRDVQYN